MRLEKVEIYSDASNSAVIRHPNRKFPGVLAQGDTLHSLYVRAERVLQNLDPESDDFYELEYVKERLQSWVSHYASVMNEHDMPCPFNVSRTSIKEDKS